MRIKIFKDKEAKSEYEEMKRETGKWVESFWNIFMSDQMKSNVENKLVTNDEW